MQKCTTVLFSLLLLRDKLIRQTYNNKYKDRRKVYISFTPTGRTMIEQTRYERDKWLNNVVKIRLLIKNGNCLVMHCLF
ncbi:MAG: hypothetical protein EZS26_002123 [Candidatus Ordinivivax streblomastigis]|uniref:HTH marR-type domain-containing protein n=1 Tax=Candidatus Ordinivivax streblomastigis TaxID=2540710 RepID=A0A5M8NZT6_9BACT|nr:MAG: hypothetical protein EZS26_002123 [Candidatus Ordinivivax streblomastigis]